MKVSLISIVEMFGQFNLIKTKLAELSNKLHHMRQLGENKLESKRDYKLVRKDIFYECDHFCHRDVYLL